MTLHLIGNIVDLLYISCLMLLGFQYTFKLNKTFEGAVLIALSSIYSNIAFNGV